MCVYIWLWTLVFGCTTTMFIFVTACSKECECRFDDDEVIISVDCSQRNLEELPELSDHYETAIRHLDLSGNRIPNFPNLPTEFNKLKYLDLTKNVITMMNETNVGLFDLIELHIGQNRIQSWDHLGPTIEKLESLIILNLTENPLPNFPYLNGPKIRVLDLSFCQITKISGKHTFEGLPQIDHLSLRGNPLRSISDLNSNTLSTLDISFCLLTSLNPSIIENLPELTKLNLSHNPRLSLTRKNGETVHSESLKILDLSFTNMDTIEISGFPNLTTVNLRGNLVKHLRMEHFEQNDALENIDLSNNAITHITSKALNRLVMLKHIDVSYNMIRRLERDTFRHNEQLTSINLSRNYIERFSRLASNSLTHLDMSWCEVLKIDLDAFSDLPMLTQVDLSNNLFSEFPATLRSMTLQSLNLSMCRLAVIRNNTFLGFPELSQLHLDGNRFTTPFRREFFADNSYLRDIWLGDNPWRCECRDDGFYEWFQYVDEDPKKLRDHVHLHCFTPENVYGLTWDTACADTWHSNEANEIASQKVFTVVFVVVFVLAVCITVCVRRRWKKNESERHEADRVSNLEAAREVVIRNQSVLEHQSQVNAPDPRESKPPCYADALLLPKFTGSFASLKGKWITDEDSVDSPMTRRHRSRSEEVLSQRDSIVEQNRHLRRQIIAEANQRISIYPVVDIPPHIPEPGTGVQPFVHRQARLSSFSESYEIVVGPSNIEEELLMDNNRD